MKYRCNDCGREWDYPVSNCIFCGGEVNKLDTNEYMVEDLTMVSIPTEEHPVIPYYVMLLKDTKGSYKFKKTFQIHHIGETVHVTGKPNERYTIGVIGTGVTGIGIAEVALRTRNKVILKSRSRAALENALNKLSANLSKSMSPEDVQVLINDIVKTTDYRHLTQSDFIIESVVEDLKVKKDIFLKLDSICDSDVVLATNTSSLRISQITHGLKYPERVVGLHFFNPITRMRLVEIIRGTHTSDDVLDKCSKLVKQLGKESIKVKDTSGFVVNRLLFTMINDACHMLEEKISSVEDIDNAMKLGANFPMGPFELADLIGLDLCMEIIQNMHEASSTSGIIPSGVLRKMVDDGRLGKKSKKGFYEY